MTWVWLPPPENNSWGADLDFKLSYPLSGGDSWSDVTLDDTVLPVYRSRIKLAKFRAFHCPPFSTSVVIDKTWQDIILEYVPRDRVQFFPVRLFAGDGVTDEFSWLISFDRVECIDIANSEIIDKVEKPGVYRIMKMELR
jgi:hypothetical protein